MIVPYVPTDLGSFYNDYYKTQVGNSLSVFRGATVQRGHGIGGFFSGLLKGTMPLIKSGAKSIGKELLNVGVNLARVALGGKDMKESAKQNFMNAGDNLLGKLSDTMKGNGFKPVKRDSGRREKKLDKKRKLVSNSGSLFKDVKVIAS